jgi:hypothetical protein
VDRGWTGASVLVVAANRQSTRCWRWLPALDPANPVRWCPPFDDEDRGPLVETGVDDLSDIGVEEISIETLRGGRGARVSHRLRSQTKHRG